MSVCVPAPIFTLRISAVLSHHINHLSQPLQSYSTYHMLDVARANMTDLIHRSRKRSLSALAVFGVCGAFSPHDSRIHTTRTRRDVQTHSSPRTHHHHHHYSHIPTAWRGGKARYTALNMIGKRGPIPIIDSADLDEKQQIDDDDNDNDMNIAATTTTTKKKKPKIKFDLLPDFMQKDPLMITKQRWIDETTIPIDIDEENARSKREKNEMMIMSVASLVLAVGVIYALASSAPEIVLPSNEEVKEIENAGRDLIRTDTSAQLELATRNIVGQVLPNSAEDAIAVTIGEGIAGVIGAFATWLLGLALNFKSDDDFTSDRQMGGGMQDMDALYSEAVADGDYFLTRAAAQPILEALGIPIFFASFASVIIATVPYEAVKLSSQKRRDDVQQQQLLEMLLEEEESRQGNMNAIDKVSNNIFEFINRLNVRANNFDDDIENEIEEEDQVSDITELQKEQLKNAAPALDYVELFADLTKWLEYDVLITNYRGLLALPNGQMLSSGWESAIFG